MSDPTQSSEVKRGDFAKKKGEVILREHEYDGIQEFDQKLPNWWLFTFYAAIVWFVVYWVLYYNTTAYQTDQQKVISAIQEIEADKSASLASAMESIDDLALVNDWAGNPEKVAAGETIYSTHCVACHAPDLSATMAVGDQKIPLPGLPLTDGEWKYGSKPLELFKIINDGTPAESAGNNGARMQAWGQTLAPEQIFEVTAYIISKNPDDFASFRH